MTAQTYIALLRAVNVGGTGKLAMVDLRQICADAGFTGARTYIAIGNVVFTADVSRAQVKVALESRLEAHTGKPVGVVLRTSAEMARVLAGNPFRDAAPNRVIVLFLDQPPPDDAAETARGFKNEEIALGEREIYVHYPDGQGPSKLVIPAAATGTGRNLNTVAKLAEMADLHARRWANGPCLVACMSGRPSRCRCHTRSRVCRSKTSRRDDHELLCRD